MPNKLDIVETSILDKVTKPKIDSRVFEMLVATLIITDNHPFTMPESPALRALVRYLQPTTKLFGDDKAKKLTEHLWLALRTEAYKDSQVRTNSSTSIIELTVYGTWLSESYRVFASSDGRLVCLQEYIIVQRRRHDVHQPSELP